MGAQIYYPGQGHNNPAVVTIHGVFSLSSSPAKKAGKGWSVARTGAGIFVVTLTDPFVKQCLGAFASLAQDVDSDTEDYNGKVNLVPDAGGDIYDVDNKQLTFHVLLDDDTSGVPALDDGDAGDLVSFVAFFSKSSLPVT